MKRLFVPAALVAMFAFSWTPAFSQASGNDDVYFSAKGSAQIGTTTPAPTTAPTTQPSNNTYQSPQGYGSYSNRYQNSAPSYSTVDSSAGNGNTTINNYYGPTNPGVGYCNPYMDPYLGFGYSPFYPSYGFGLDYGFYGGIGFGFGFGYGYYDPFYNPFYPYYGYGFGEGFGFGSYYGPRRIGGLGLRSASMGGITGVRSSIVPRGAEGHTPFSAAQRTITSPRTNVPFSRPASASSAQFAPRGVNSGSTRSSAIRQNSYAGVNNRNSNIPRSNVHNYYNGRSSSATQRTYANASHGSFTPRGGFNSYQSNRSSSIGSYHSSGSFGGYRSSGSFGGSRSSGSFSNSSRGSSFSGGGGGARGYSGGGGRR